MKRITVLFVALALFLTACQFTVEEQFEESSGVVGVDTDSGPVSIETDEGSFTFGGGEIPEGFRVPLPNGYTVLNVIEAEGKSSVSVSYPLDTFDAIVGYFESWTNSQSGEWSGGTSTFDQGTGQVSRSAIWYSADLSITVADCLGADSTSDAFNAICVIVLDI